MSKESDVLTSVQIRVARTLLRWSARELAEHASLNISTIKRMEHWETIPGVRDETVQKAQAALEAAGIKFTKRENGDPGVRFHELGQNWEAPL